MPSIVLGDFICIILSPSHNNPLPCLLLPPFCSWINWTSRRSSHFSGLAVQGVQLEFELNLSDPELHCNLERQLAASSGKVHTLDWCPAYHMHSCPVSAATWFSCISLSPSLFLHVTPLVLHYPTAHYPLLHTTQWPTPVSAFYFIYKQVQERVCGSGKYIEKEEVGWFWWLAWRRLYCAYQWQGKGRRSPRDL